jgi:hypothetical protein
MTRRDLLRGTTIVAAAVTASAGVCRPAAAFKIEQVPATSDMALLYASRCGTPADHRAIIAALKARLDEKIAAGDTADVEVAACPLCGCRVVVSAADERIEPLRR